MQCRIFAWRKALAIRCSSVGGLLPGRRCPSRAQLAKLSDAPHQPSGQIIRAGPCFSRHRGVGTRLDASRQGARSVRRAGMRRHVRGRLRQGPVVRTGRRQVCRTNRSAIGRPARDMRDSSKTLHRPQAQQEFSTGLRLQQQNLFQRLLPPRLPDRQISRWKVLMRTTPAACRDPLFRHIIAYKLPRSCFARAGLPARTKARARRPSSRGG